MPTWYTDGDGDGHGAGGAQEACTRPPGTAATDDDCDDSNAAIHPGAPELCNGGIDDDCAAGTEERCRSCLHWRVGGASASGTYALDLGGSRVEVWCEMTEAGGGWTLVQRGVWDWAANQVLAADYDTWRHANAGSATDPGQAYRLRGDLWDDLLIEEEHLLHLVPRDAVDGADCDSVWYARPEPVALTVDDGGATLSDPSDADSAAPTAIAWRSFFSHTELSSMGDDRDVRDDDLSCVDDHGGGVPWFMGHCCNTCFAYQAGFWSDAPHPMASYLHDPTAYGWRTDGVDELDGLAAPLPCPGGAGARLPDSGSDLYRGLNRVEYYVR